MTIAIISTPRQVKTFSDGHVSSWLVPGKKRIVIYSNSLALIVIKCDSHFWIGNYVCHVSIGGEYCLSPRRFIRQISFWLKQIAPTNWRTEDCLLLILCTSLVHGYAIITYTKLWLGLRLPDVGFINGSKVTAQLQAKGSFILILRVQFSCSYSNKMW
jgi:hypothetical protein